MSQWIITRIYNYRIFTKQRALITIFKDYYWVYYEQPSQPILEMLPTLYHLLWCYLFHYIFSSSFQLPLDCHLPKGIIHCMQHLLVAIFINFWYYGVWYIKVSLQLISPEPRNDNVMSCDMNWGWCSSGFRWSITAVL
jgi:hypothetical protein